MNRPAEMGTLIPLPMVPAGNLVDMAHGTRSLGDLVLPKATRAALDRVLTENRAAQQLLELGLRPANRLLLCGPPGCGKTVAADAIAAELAIPLARVRLDAVIASHLGETAAKLRQVFDVAKHSRVVLFLDEVDALGGSRDSAGGDGASAEMRRVVNSFLVMLEEIQGPSLVIAATNYQGVLDPALWRRFDEIMMFPRPTGAEATALLRRVIGRYRPRDAYVPGQWSRRLAGLSFGDVERVALDIVKAMTLDAATSLERALRGAMDRQIGRQALTKTPRRK